MRVREPREPWIAFLFVWAAGFGGIPAVLIASSVADGVGVPLLLWLFPAVAAIVVVIGVRRVRRAGFVLSEVGIEGAHDVESGLLPWSDVERIEWRHAGPTSSVRVNGRPLPSGPALYAVGGGGRAWRLMQSCATRDAQLARINDRLAQVAAAGRLPVVFDPDVPTPTGGDDGTDDPAISGPAPADRWEETAVRRWSSSGAGEEPPQADSSLDDPPVWPSA